MHIISGQRSACKRICTRVKARPPSIPCSSRPSFSMQLPSHVVGQVSVSCRSLVSVVFLSALLCMCCSTGVQAQLVEGPVVGESCTAHFPYLIYNGWNVLDRCTHDLRTTTAQKSCLQRCVRSRAAPSCQLVSGIPLDSYCARHMRAGKEAYEPTPRFSEVLPPDTSEPNLTEAA